MTKAKKVLSLVLAVVMVAAMFAFSASAATQNATFTVSVDKTPVTVGEEITVTVNLETDYYTASTNVPVYYDPAVFEFVAGSVVTTPIFGAGTTGIMSYNDAATGCLKVGFYPDTTAGDATAQMMNGTLFTFKLRAIANGTSDIALHAEDQKSATNVGGALYCGAYASSEPDNNPATVGQAFTINNTSATVGSTVEAADLELKAGAAAGIIIDRNKTFGEQYDGVVYGFTLADASKMLRDTAMYTSNLEATNGGSLTFTAVKVGRYNCYGTGAAINVLNSDGTVAKKYAIVIFGDVNSDGAITATDTGVIASHVKGTALITNDVLVMAANTKEEGRTTAQKATSAYKITAKDTGLVSSHVKGSVPIDQAAAATFQNSYNTNYQ